MSEPLRVIVVDDQPVIVNGFTQMLQLESDIVVVGAAFNGLEAIEVAAQLRPDVVLMDVRMPIMDGIEATRHLIDRRTAGAVLMMTTFDDDRYLRDSAAAGASGFLLKNAGPDLLAAAVRSASKGDALIDPAMTRALLERSAHFSASGQVSREYSTRLSSLSDREREVLGLVARGLSNAEIGEQLFLGEATIKTHLSNIFTKVNARSRVGVVLFSYESGFLKPHWARSVEHLNGRGVEGLGDGQGP